MEIEYTHHKTKHTICTNCGMKGHNFKACKEGIISIGFINMRILDDQMESKLLKHMFCTQVPLTYHLVSSKYPDLQCVMVEKDNKLLTYEIKDSALECKTLDQLSHFSHYRNRILFMMVSKQFSIGFVDFLRGKYKVNVPSTIKKLFEFMYVEEIEMVGKMKYDDLLNIFVNRSEEAQSVILSRTYEGKYSKEYCEGKIKFNMLKYAHKANIYIPHDLQFYVTCIKPRWPGREWGFPKGRRDHCHENNLTCARREFEEETGYQTNEYVHLDKIEPVHEQFIGTNHMRYNYIYYLSLDNSQSEEHDHDIYEIHQIQWFTYDQAMAHIRDYQNEKKVVLTQVYLFMLNCILRQTDKIHLFS